MHTEIEAKIKVNSLPEIARRLKAVGAKFLGKRLQIDVYLDDDKSTLRKADSALRIRRSVLRSSGNAAAATEDRQVIGRKERAIITFKGPRLGVGEVSAGLCIDGPSRSRAKQKGRFKRREEVQFEVDDAASAETFLAAIGYKKTLAFQKKRRIWRLDDCEVALDELPLMGSFVEIEGPCERKIAAVQKKLGLSDLPHIPESYASLMKRKLRKLGRKRREILL